MNLRLETPPLESLGPPPADDDARSTALAQLMASPEVNAIARILANVQRKRLGFTSVFDLESLAPEEIQHYREQAVIAIRSLNTEHVDQAIDAAAQMYALKTYGLTFDSLSDNKRVFCAHAARAICNRFRRSLSRSLSGALTSRAS